MTTAQASGVTGVIHACTALHADVSGFTALADRLDADELHEIIAPVIEALTSAAEGRGGLLLKYGGDAVLVVFGIEGPAGDHAERALEAALDMHARIDVLRGELPPAGQDLELHVGVASGPVPAGIALGMGIDRVLAGETLTGAQRIEADTPAGATHVAHATVSLVGHRFRFGPIDGPAGTEATGTQRLVGVGSSSPSTGGREQAVRDLLYLMQETSPGATAFAEERRLVTAMFVDVGSGAFPDGHVQEARLVERLIAVAEGYGGHVSRYAGDALLVAYGAPVAQDDDAVRAVLTAIDMHATAQSVAADVRLRIGINSGHVVAARFGGRLRTDRSVLGDAINVAQRLQASSRPGETYVGEATVGLVGSHVDFAPIAGGLRLKGKPQPVPAWRVVARGRPEVTHAVRHMVGRAGELDRAVGMLDGTMSGAGGVLLISGEPGVGKSRLSDEVQQHATRRGMIWLPARCLSYGAAVPYWPYAELLRRTYGLPLTSVTAASGARLSRALAEEGLADAFPYFARLLGVEDPAGPAAGTGPAFRRGLHRAFENWLERHASSGPTVLAIEDVHWMDASSVDLTTALAQAIAGRRLSIVATARPEGATILRDLSGRVMVEEILLSPLDGPGVAELAQHVLGGPPPKALVAPLHGRAGGNPFFVIELVRSLVEAAELWTDGGRWRLRRGWDEGSLPTTVEGVLASRLDRLPAGASRTLSVAAVVGRQVRPALLRGVLGEGGHLDAELDELVARGFLERGPDGSEVLLFRHALVQEVAYRRLVRRRRQELHRTVADTAEALYGAGDEVIDLLARHRYLAGEEARALPYLLRAARRARELFANDEAILHLSRGVEILRRETTSDDPTTELVLELAELYDLVGEYDRAFELHEEVRRTKGDARAWRGVAAVLRKRGEYDAAFAAVDEALRERQVGPVAAAALELERGWSLSFVGRYEEAIAAFERGLALVGDADPRLAGRLLVQSVRPALMLARHDEALVRARAAQRAFEDAGDVVGLPSALRVLGDAYWESGRLTEAAESLRRGIELADRVGSVEDLCSCLVNLGLVELERGALEEAIACDERAVDEYERIGHASGCATAYANLAEKLFLAGRLEEAEAHGDRGLELARSIGFTAVEADALRTRARLLLERGEHRAALEAARTAAELFASIGQEAAADECVALGDQAGQPCEAVPPSPVSQTASRPSDGSGE